MIFPNRLEDWVGEDSVMRPVDFFVDELDLSELGFQRRVAAGTGRSGYHPAFFLSLFIYGNLNISRRAPGWNATRQRLFIDRAHQTNCFVELSEKTPTS